MVAVAWSPEVRASRRARYELREAQRAEDAFVGLFGPPGETGADVVAYRDASARAARLAADAARKGLSKEHLVGRVRFGADRLVVCLCGAGMTGRTDEALADAFARHRVSVATGRGRPARPPARDVMTASA